MLRNPSDFDSEAFHNAFANIVEQFMASIHDALPGADDRATQMDRTYGDMIRDVADVLHGIFGSGAEGPWDDSVGETARRVVKYWYEFAGQDDAEQFLPTLTTFPAGKSQMVMCSNIEFSSICAHHLLPFVGVAHVAYIPNEIQIGLSKIPRLVDWVAKRPQVQERMGEQIIKYMKDLLKPQGTMVVIAAQHTCMCGRGVRKHNGRMQTSIPSGVFLTNPAARDEFFNLLRLEQQA